ncbi:putative oxidoreductase SadH [Abditibacteriota bacterium]|nr:putative oxidoreductase SadH [Abditibacteriota bacterium]
MKFKPLNEQVIVITGATSGIGLVTARVAARRGAKIVVASRDEDSLRQLCEEVRAKGGQAEYAVTDVGDEEQVKALAKTAVEKFGGFDTWVNNAGGAIYGLLVDVPTEDHRKLFDTNFWGIVYGSLAAARHFKERGENADYAGVIINLGSVESDRTIPLQGMYATSKHAVKGFTDALRMELAHEKVPVALSLIKPSAIATPFPDHARNYMEKDPTLPPPLYSPETVAEAILNCAVAPQRDVIVGGGGKSFSILGQWFPGLGDMIVGSKPMFESNKRKGPGAHPSDALYEAGSGMEERGEFPGVPVLEGSQYTQLVQSPVAKVALIVAVGAGVMAWALRNSSRK